MGLTLEELKAALPEDLFRRIAGQLGRPDAAGLATASPRRAGPDRPPRHSKYGATPTYADGLRFDSRKEATRFAALKMLRDAGDVLWFARQPRFALAGSTDAGKAEYVADFVVAWKDGRVTVEDVKGMKTKEYRLKKQQVETLYRIKIIEV